MGPDQTGAQLRDGQLLADRYLVEGLIGRGGMAEVYRARDQRLARPVALKVLRPHFAHDPALRRRFEEEAKAAAHVASPNVVAVYDAGEDDSKAFIVMELVGGETLHDLIARGPLDSATARSVGAQVLDALAAAHARGVLHRDIKPANVLLTPDGQAKVADFGIAKAVHPSPDSHDQTTMNMVLGTPSYLAPERAQGAPATAASDLWSVGVLLYESLTGEKPFQGENAIAVSLAATQGRYVPVNERRPDVEPALAGVVSRALSPDPAARYSSAEEMAAALRSTAAAGADPTALMAGGVAGAEATRVLGAGEGGVAPTSVLAGAGVAGGGALAGASAAGAATLPPVAPGGPTAGGPLPPRRSRRGAAVLAGAVAAILIGGLIAALLLLPGPNSHQPTNTTGKKQHSTTTTSTSPPTTSAPTTTKAPPSSTAPTTTAAPTTSSSVPTTTAAPTTSSIVPTTTVAPTSSTLGPTGTTGTSTKSGHGAPAPPTSDPPPTPNGTPTSGPPSGPKGGPGGH